MSLTTTLFTGLTGMDVHTKSLSVIGNNITNINSTAFKASRAVFESQLSSTMHSGSGPNATSGGTNPNQIGLGVLMSGTKRNFANGSIQPTGINTDLALEGPGFFILRQNGQNFYTRAGNFDLDAERRLVSVNGGVVQGYGIDGNFNINTGPLQDIQIPLGTLTVAEASRNVNLAGNLNASGIVATQGSITQSQELDDSSANPLSGASLLTDLVTLGDVTALFATGDVLTIRGAEKGGKSMGEFTFHVGATANGADAFGTTLDDLMTFLNDVLGINTDASIADGAGVSLSGNRLQIAGNLGSLNDLKLDTADLFKSVVAGGPTQPFTFSKSQSANGESVRTSFVVYDSLGTPLTVDLMMVLSDKTPDGTTWRYFAESMDDTDLARVLENTPGTGGTGLLNFNTFGALTSGDQPYITIDRLSTGAVDPLTITLNFADAGQPMTSLTDTISTLAAVYQDGSPIGTLAAFGIGEDGIIVGAFTNGLIRQLGQVALATFTNPEGLVDVGGGKYSAGANSGAAVTVVPLTFGAGRVISGALELSNVDLSQEFVNLITATTGFTASSRVITTADQLIQQLLAMSR